MLVEGRRHSVELCDLSDHGFGARSPSPIPIGSEISVWLPGRGEVTAQVRWALCGQFGAKFVHRTNRSVDGKLLRAALPAPAPDHA
jgi:hypothetical protein